ncbi:hypothetical protein GBP346_B1670 [Burkholderia pseudomallei MSHR346]|nr:hypothetical protein GBP346_B1670 [Burkholderia pseudomallei MSHR346]
MTNRRRRSGFRRRRFFQWRAPRHPARRSPQRGLRRFCFNRRRCGRQSFDGRTSAGVHRLSRRGCRNRFAALDSAPSNLRDCCNRRRSNFDVARSRRRYCSIRLSN